MNIEGRKRLKFFLSVVICVIVYIFQIINYEDSYRYLKAEELFFQFPIIALVFASLAFAGSTGFFWVLDGFSGSSQSQQPHKMSAEDLCKVCDESASRLFKIVSTNLSGKGIYYRVFIGQFKDIKDARDSLNDYRIKKEFRKDIHIMARRDAFGD